MRPESNEAIDRERVERSQRFVDSSHPPREFSRTVHVMSLDVRRETALRGEIEFDHGGGERFGVGAERRDDFEKGTSESSVDLLERRLSRVVDHDERSVAEESVGERDSSGVGRRIAGADELDPLELDPRLVARLPVSTVLDQLTHERDDLLRSVLVRCWQIDLVAEQYDPLSNLNRRENDAVRGLAVLTVLLERLEEQFGSRRAREIESNHFQVGKLSQRAEQRHRLSGSWRTAEEERAMLREPGVEDLFVSGRVHCRNYDIGRENGVRFDLDRRDGALPRYPIASRDGDVVVDERGAGSERGEIDSGMIAEEIPHLRARLQLRVSGERPHDRDEESLRDVGLDLLHRHREIGMLAVEFNDVASRFVEEGEEGGDGADGREIHDMID